ncbi:hypothetical protein FXO38_00861 [Capsicum annuum]|nr:hypothetical protein FXO38_00861 [Capsicum annuum]
MHGTHPLLGNREGKHSMSQERGEVGTLLREGRLASRVFRDEAFWRSQVNFGPPNPTTDEKDLWSKGKRVHCHTPCLQKVPREKGKLPFSPPHMSPLLMPLGKGYIDIISVKSHVSNETKPFSSCRFSMITGQMGVKNG